MTPVHLPASKTRVSMEPCARFELTFPEYRSGASPRMLTGPSLTYIKSSRRRYSKPRLRGTSAVLFRLSYSGLERVRRIELR